MQANVNKRHINRAGGSSSYSKKDLLFYLLLLLLPLTQLAIFYFGVNFQSFFFAFQSYDAFTGSFHWDAATNFHRFFGGDGYEGMITTPWFWKMIGNSCLVYLCTSLAGTVLATFFSYYIYKKRTASTFFKIILLLPSILPSILLIIVFKIFVGQGIPAFQDALTGEFMGNIWAESGNRRFWMITLFTVWISFGGQVLVYTGAMDTVNEEVLEAGKIDGASPAREFFSLILPEIIPTVSTFLVTGLANIFTAQNNLFAFTEGGASPSEYTVGYYLYMLVYADSSKSNYPFASFMGLIFTIVIVPVLLLVIKLTNKVNE